MKLYDYFQYFNGVNSEKWLIENKGSKNFLRGR